MVFFMEDDKPTKITVEKSENPVLLGSEKESKELFEDLFKSKLEQQKAEKSKKKGEIDDEIEDEVEVKGEVEGEIKSEKEDETEPQDFKLSGKFDPDSLNRPKDLKIKQIEIAGLDEIFEPEGVAIFHYFSNGLVEETLIQVQDKDESLKWTLVTDPLTGEIYTISGHKILKEIKKP